jgi:hypothetical protein
LTNYLAPGQQQALEACIKDATSFMNLFSKAREHPQAALIFNGLIAHASMFVVESHRCLTTLFPDAQDAFSLHHADLLRKSRHRAKLLDNAEKTIEDVTADLIIIARRQRDIFLEPHSGFLGPLKRALQPDMGLSIFDGHIITTTHSTIFEFGEDCDLDESAFAFGKAIGAYTATVLNMFKIEIPLSVGPTKLPGNIEMRDIKYEALYTRGPLDTDRMDISAGLILILTNINFVIYILSRLLSADSHTLFRIKFFSAFHANSNLRSIQDRLIANKFESAEIANFFKEALGNSESRWLRKQKSLRNLLTHYLPDARMVSELPVDATRLNAIEYYGGGLSFGEINALLDRNIILLSGLLETNYKLVGDPFWFGKVK